MTQQHILSFHRRILQWAKKQSRKNLPWQKNKTPYSTWISEIMLQQTQVKTVIPYFKRFIKQFSTIESLARASQDEILKLWSGLGYYTRARNLHRCSQIIVSEYQGCFPSNLKLLQQLPGIGRSTAGAILSLGLKKRAAILDGNIQRVISRYFLVEGNPTSSITKNKLWKLAEMFTPTKQYAIYNQAMMDLGALICTRQNPSCKQCPLAARCQARLKNRIKDFPFSKISKKLPIKSIYFLLIKNAQGKWLLQKRPSIGIWGGLFSFPQCATLEKLESFCLQQFSIVISKEKIELPSFRHTLSHIHFNITPLLVKVASFSTTVMETSDTIWYDLKDPFPYGIPKPVKQVLEQLVV